MSHEDGADWDARYAEQEKLWSGQPNGALVAEVAALKPGRALDVGCGEGADAIWLAARGWDVAALDVSGVALARAAEHAREAGVKVSWIHAGLVEAALEPASFDLVSAQYFALPRTPGREAERALLDSVAVGGTLLLVHHFLTDEHAHHGGFDRDDYVSISAVDEQRPRTVPDHGAGSHHADDNVVRARRLR